MSSEAIAWAMGRRTGSATSKLVLLVLADAAGEDYRCWPQQRVIAQRAEISERSVRTQLQHLQGAGLIAREANLRTDNSRRPDVITLRVSAE